jgi:hypothetical protein
MADGGGGGQEGRDRKYHEQFPDLNFGSEGRRERLGGESGGKLGEPVAPHGMNHHQEQAMTERVVAEMLHKVQGLKELNDTKRVELAREMTSETYERSGWRGGGGGSLITI